MKLRPAGMITKIVIIALILYAGISLLSLKARIEDAREDMGEMQAKVEKARQENAELQYEIEHSEDEATIEDIARNKLGLVKPGEKIFYDVSN